MITIYEDKDNGLLIQIVQDFNRTLPRYKITIGDAISTTLSIGETQALCMLLMDSFSFGKQMDSPVGVK